MARSPSCVVKLRLARGEVGWPVRPDVVLCGQPDEAVSINPGDGTDPRAVGDHSAAARHGFCHTKADSNSDLRVSGEIARITLREPRHFVICATSSGD
jgi:hypothetical protein